MFVKVYTEKVNFRQRNKNIFDRLVFSDENDNIYKDDDYKNAHRTHYLKEIKEDLAWYGSVFKNVKYHFNMSGRSAEDVVSALIREFQLDKV